MITLGSASRLQRLYRLHILTIPRQWGSLTVSRKQNTLMRAEPVFVKEVVRRFHAASLISGTLISVSGLSQTGPAGCQLRVLPVQRFGFCDRAFA